jgi:Ca-activated chloride channel family protein
MEDEEFGSVVFEEYDEQYMYFLGLALLCFVIQMVTGSRKPRRKLFEV